MTLDEFCAALEATPRDWVLIKTKIRRHGPCGIPQCPITALTGHIDYYWSVAASKLGIDFDDASHIAAAADFQGLATWKSPFAGLRRRLLAACGLEEMEENG